MASAELYDLTVRLRGNTGSYEKAVKKSTAETDGFTQSVKGVSRGLTAVEGPLSGVTTRFESLRGIVSGAAIGYTLFGASVAASGLLLKSSLATFGEYETTQLRTEQLIEATGSAAGFTAQQLTAHADAVALSTLASVSGIRQTQDILLTFKSIQGEVFLEATKLAQDMAAVFGGEAKDKALQLGKALESPIEGQYALKRSGVSLTDSQKDVVKSLVETGHKAEAQRVILDELAKQVGGSGAAQAGGLAGSVDTITQRWDEFKLSLATSTGAGKTATTVIASIADHIDNLNQMMMTSDAERLNDLVTKRLDLQQKLTAAQEAVPRYNGGGESRRTLQLKDEIKAVNTSILEIQNRRVDQIKKEKKALDDAAAFKRNAEKEDAAARQKLADDEAAKALAKQQENSARWLDDIDLRYAKQEEKIGIYYQRELAQIDELELTKQQIEVRGFETIEQLRADYRAQALANAEKSSLELAMVRQKESDREKKRLEDDTRLRLATWDGYTGLLIEGLEAAGKEQSALYKAMFIAQKAQAIPSMIVSTEEAATDALTLGPIAGPIAAGIIKGLGYASIGTVMGQSIGSFALGGIIPGNSYTGDSLTANVNSREMVLNLSQQKRLFDIAQGVNSTSTQTAAQSAANGMPSLTINLIEDAEKAGQSSVSQNTDGSYSADVFVANLQNRGKERQALESMYPSLKVS